jgi:tRNA(adenine34) deaminase
MQEAVVEARKAAAFGEVPVGAVCVYEGSVVSRSHNLVEKNRDASAHAEILAMRAAAEVLGNWRLEGLTLYVTLEPCTMCIGAMILARVSSLYFGADDQRQGAVGSIYNLSALESLPHQIEVTSGVMAEECSFLLKEFFLQQRSS